jgi:apolipoprotein N-acyltransferase
MASQKGFFELLFDFSFSRFLALRIIGFLYGLGIFFAGILTLIIIIGAFSSGFWSGLGSLVISPIVFLLYLIGVRMVLEGFVASIRTAENTTQLVEYTKIMLNTSTDR